MNAPADPPAGPDESGRFWRRRDRSDREVRKPASRRRPSTATPDRLEAPPVVDLSQAFGPPAPAESGGWSSGAAPSQGPPPPAPPFAPPGPPPESVSTSPPSRDSDGSPEPRLDDTRESPALVSRWHTSTGRGDPDGAHEPETQTHLPEWTRERDDPLADRGPTGATTPAERIRGAHASPPFDEPASETSDGPCTAEHRAVDGAWVPATVDGPTTYAGRHGHYVEPDVEPDPEPQQADDLPVERTAESPGVPAQAAAPEPGLRGAEPSAGSRLDADDEHDDGEEEDETVPEPEDPQNTQDTVPAGLDDQPGSVASEPGSEDDASIRPGWSADDGQADARLAALQAAAERAASLHRAAELAAA
ncbi:MAG: hypothetical protein LH468_07495, partial [Nocardioides sp.]|nr:hypothetical protein [Nocardioides sp.]